MRLEEIMRIGTRKSKLALRQTEMVTELLENIGIECELVKISTLGDRRYDLKLNEFGGKGAFVEEIESAILDGSIDIAVHSAKDLPLELCEGLTIGAVLKRGNIYDVLAVPKGTPLDEVKIVGTGSLRRKAQLEERYSFKCSNIRGNIDTRLNKALTEEYDGVVLAMAGLERMQYNSDERFDFYPLDIIPAACQGIIAIECRENSDVHSLLKNIDDKATRVEFECERAFITAIQLGCQSPVGVNAVLNGDEVTIEAVVYNSERHSLKKTVRLGNEIATAVELAQRLKRTTE
jgi:hydroxymethylbilane synthase